MGKEKAGSWLSSIKSAHKDYHYFKACAGYNEFQDSLVTDRDSLSRLQINNHKGGRVKIQGL